MSGVFFIHTQHNRRRARLDRQIDRDVYTEKVEEDWKLSGLELIGLPENHADDLPFEAISFERGSDGTAVEQREVTQANPGAKKGGGAAKHLPEKNRAADDLEDELQYERYAADPAAKKCVGPEEVRVRRQYVTLRCGCRGNACRVEDVPVAESKVRVVQDVEHIRPDLEVFLLAKVGVLGHGQVQYIEAWREEAIAAHISLCAWTSHDVFGLWIDWRVPNCGEGSAASWIGRIKTTASRGHAGGHVKCPWSAV